MLKRLHHLLLKLIVPLVFLSQTLTAIGQNVIEVDSLKSPRIPYKKTLDPQLLVAQLIEGKETQKEKFDVIFSWVANNIYYNYRLYNSGRPNQKKSIKRILRTRIGVCTDYAKLMDTLCGFAGILNTSVNGYTKDIMFDVNDSLFFEDHTWNAVKLDNKWFLYDVTWTAGATRIELNRFGKWREKVIEEFRMKTVKKVEIFKMKSKKDPLCGIPENSFSDTSIVTVQKKWYRFLTWALNLFPYRYKPVHNFVRNKNYYLTDPEVFALEHFPVDSIWSLSPTYNSLDIFVKDSSHYFHHVDRFKEQFKNQAREGQHCFDCDDYLGLSEFKQNKYLINLTTNYLPQNPFLKAFSELNITAFFYKDFKKEQDSAQKIALFDSTLLYLNASIEDFRACNGPSSRDFRYQAAKNKAKNQQLNQENRNHLKTIGQLFSAVNKRKKKISSLEYKSESYEKRSIQAIRRFSNAFRARVTAIRNDQKLKAIQSDFERAKAKSDSLSQKIVGTRDSLLLQSRILWKNLSKHLYLLGPISRKFNSDSGFRKYGLLDSYDYIVRQNRQGIDSLELLFVSNVERDVLVISDTMYATFMSLYRMIYQRDQSNLKAAKLGLKLRASGILSSQELSTWKISQLGLSGEDVCWNRDQKYLMKFVQDNFIRLYYQHKGLRKLISNNSNNENSRFLKIRRYNEMKRKRITSASTANIELLRRVKKMTYSELDRFKKKLKKK